MSQDLSPLPIADLTTNSHSEIGLLAGFFRSVVYQLLLFWFRTPLKFFRPMRIDYTTFLRSSSHSTSLFSRSFFGMLLSSFHKKGHMFIYNYVLPQFLVNSFIGVSLFSSYNFFLEKFKQNNLNLPHFSAGFFSGIINATVSAPFDSKMINEMTKNAALSPKKYNSMWQVYKDGFRKQTTKQMYKGLVVNMLKDSVGFCVFFGTYNTLFEYFQNLSKSNSKNNKINSYYYPLSSILSGMVAGLGYQLVEYPMIKIHTEYIESNKNIRQPFLFIKRKISSKNFIKNYYFGFSSCLYKSLPASTLGIVFYQYIKDSLQ